jgi:hypothetical protein
LSSIKAVAKRYINLIDFFMKINTTLVNGEPRVKMNHSLKIFEMAHLCYPIIQTFSFWPLDGVALSLVLNEKGQKGEPSAKKFAPFPIKEFLK